MDSDEEMVGGVIYENQTRTPCRCYRRSYNGAHVSEILIRSRELVCSQSARVCVCGVVGEYPTPVRKWRMVEMKSEFGRRREKFERTSPDMAGDRSSLSFFTKQRKSCHVSRPRAAQNEVTVLPRADRDSRIIATRRNGKIWKESSRRRRRPECGRVFKTQSRGGGERQLMTAEQRQSFANLCQGVFLQAIIAARGVFSVDLERRVRLADCHQRSAVDGGGERFGGSASAVGHRKSNVGEPASSASGH